MSFAVQAEITNRTLPPPEPQGLIHTLDRQRFDTACACLMRQVVSKYPPDLLVGIRTGGLVVAEAMAQSGPGYVPVLPLTCRRVATGMKSRLKVLPWLLARLPQPIVDRLRWLEHRLLSKRRRSSSAPQQIDHTEAITIGQHLARATAPCRVLVVDDAVDSGVTLSTVLNLLRRTCPPQTEFRTAVVTVTLTQPLVEPDFLLYRGVLCRFPWSFDATG